MLVTRMAAALRGGGGGRGRRAGSCRSMRAMKALIAAFGDAGHAFPAIALGREMAGGATRS